MVGGVGALESDHTRRSFGSCVQRVPKLYAAVESQVSKTARPGAPGAVETHSFRKPRIQRTHGYLDGIWLSPKCFVRIFHDPKSVAVLPSGSLTAVTTCMLPFGSIIAAGTSNLCRGFQPG